MENRPQIGPLDTAINQQETERAIEKDELLDEAECLYAGMIHGTNPLENSVFFNYLTNLSPEDQIKIASRFGERECKKIERSLGAKFVTCACHPGVLARIEDFIQFSTALVAEKPETTPQQAMADFSDHLGNVTLYRGMAINEEELEIIKSVGILAPHMRRKEDGVSSLKFLLDPNTPSRLEIKEEDVADYFRRDKEKDDAWKKNRTVLPKPQYRERLPYSFEDDMASALSEFSNAYRISFSASKYPEVASSVGWHNSKTKGLPGVFPYLFQINIPKILTYDQYGLWHEHVVAKRVEVGDKSFEGELEYFIPFSVPVSAIEAIERTDIPPESLVHHR